MKEKTMNFEKLFRDIFGSKRRSEPTGPQAGVNMNGSMFLHCIKKIELDYRTRQARDTATATMKVTDAEGHKFAIHFMSPPDGNHIEVETHDHNEK
jgi:hypothetical protein